MSDTNFGHEDNDTFYDAADDDFLDGSDGDDHLHGDAGDEELYGARATTSSPGTPSRRLKKDYWLATYRLFMKPWVWRLSGSARMTARSVAGALVALALCSCAAISDPYVTPSEPTTSTESPTFSEATKYALDKAELMHTKLRELDSYDFGTSSVILASGVAGIGLAAYGAHPDVLIAAGLGGSTAYGARSYLPIQDRKLIYAKGASAITCAVAALSLGNLAGAIQETESAANRAESGAGALMEAYSQINQFRTTQSDPTAQTQNAKDQADSLITEAKSIKDRRGAMLISATDAILHSVTDQLIMARLDPEGAMNALQSRAQSFTSALRDTYQKLEASAESAKEETEDVEKSANEQRSIATAQAQLLNQQPTLQATEAASADVAQMLNTATKASEAAEKAKENKRTLDEVVSSAARILEIVNLRSTCAAQL